MVFVSFWTDNGYRGMAARLKASLDKFGLKHAIHQVPNPEVAGTWRDQLRAKPGFILGQLCSCRCPVVWLDADCEVMQLPSLLFTAAYDFAAYNWYADPENLLHKPYDPHRCFISGGVMLFNYTAPSMELLLRWIDEQQRPGIEDDPALNNVFNTERPPVRCLWLPRSYNRMRCQFPETTPVIDHDYRGGNHRQDREPPACN